MSQLVTGEAVALDLRPARLPTRILARVIDFAIELVLTFVLVQVFTGPLSLADSDFAAAIGIVGVAAFVVGYPTFCETLMRGRTPGKAALGIRVVRDDGGPIGFRHALTRGLFNVVDVWLTSGAAGLVSSLVSRTGKRLGDLVAGTFVVQERLPRQYVAPIPMPPPLASWAATLDLSRLPDDLALAVRGYLGRVNQLRPEARDRLGAEFATAVASYVSPPPPPGTPGWAFLAAVVAERRRRDEARARGPAHIGGPSPWQPAPPSSGWGTTPATPSWSASAPPTGTPPPVGAPPAVGRPPADPGPPRLPSAPSPQWGPQPVPPPPPPSPVAATGAGPEPDRPSAPPVTSGAGPATARAEPSTAAEPTAGFAPPG